jgi:hypothetical protein
VDAPEPPLQHQDQPAANDALPKPVADDALPQPVVDIALLQPVVDIALPQPMANNAFPQPVADDADNSLPQPVADIALPQPVADNVLPQPVADHALPQLARGADLATVVPENVMGLGLTNDRAAEAAVPVAAPVSAQRPDQPARTHPAAGAPNNVVGLGQDDIDHTAHIAGHFAARAPCSSNFSRRPATTLSSRHAPTLLLVRPMLCWGLDTTTLTAPHKSQSFSLLMRLRESKFSRRPATTLSSQRVLAQLLVRLMICWASDATSTSSHELQSFTPSVHLGRSKSSKLPATMFSSWRVPAQLLVLPMM